MTNEASASSPGALTLIAALSRGAELGCATGVGVAIADSINVGLSAFDGQLGFLFWYALSALTASYGLVGTLLGGWTWLCVRFLPKRPNRWAVLARAALFGVPGALFMAWVPTSWLAEHWEELGERAVMITSVVYCCAFVIATALAWVSVNVVTTCLDSPSRSPRPASRSHYWVC